MIYCNRFAWARWSLWSGAALLLGAGEASAQRAERPGAEGQGADATVLVVGTREKQALDTPNATASRLGLTPLETPASIVSLDGETIRARGDLSIVEAEARAPGIASVANPGNGGTALSARGFSGQGSVLQLIDGVRLFPAAGTITFPTDPWMVERIDILSGPASVLYGQGALGGAVNVVMRGPTARTHGQAEIGYGAQDSFRASAGIGGPLGDSLGYRVDASYRRSDGYVDRGHSDSVALSGTLKWTPSPVFAVTVRGDHGDQRPIGYFGTPLIDGKLDLRIRDRNYNVGDSRMRFRDDRASVRIDWTPSANVSLSNIAYYLTSDRFWRNLEDYCWVSANGRCADGSTGTPGTIRRSSNYGIRHDQTQWGDQASVTWRAGLAPGIANALVIGGEANLVRFTHENDFGSDGQVDAVDPFAFDPGRFLDTQGIAPRYRTRTAALAIFAEDRVTLGRHWSVVGGFRYEENQVRRWAIAYPGGVRTDSFAFEKTFRNATWRAGVVYQPMPTLSLYGQYATGVDPLGTLTTVSTGQVAFSNARGNQIEAGAKWLFLNGRGTATLAAYRIVKTGLLAQRTLSSPVEQVGQRSAQGMEAAVTLDLPQGFGIDANGTLLDARFDDFRSGGTDYGGRTPPNVPEALGNLWLRWDATTRVQARGGLRYVGRRFSDNGNAFRIPGCATVDATLSYALTPQMAVDVRVYNLFDKAYAITAYGDQQWILGRPRSLDIGLRAAF
ncbi:TonB-dependent receptor [Sphingomonas sanguinis]|uniref:TonB-dependent receptor n=1 Tax=Sphingomonas sp. LC-1 TaxID=3110957 RepID=UPI0021BA47CA|nr:TonB-dependent receptor [Sphingomonas sp. LC-1]MCT8003896.1 TonB-dependent receptor [Sphingomonas sp. LC-1]